MDDWLLQLMEELVASIEHRDAGDPDAPARERQRRIERLEEELARRVRRGLALSTLPATAADEVLTGTH